MTELATQGENKHGLGSLRVSLTTALKHYFEIFLVPLMTTDLTCLLLLALWSIPLNHVPALARVAKGGIAWGMSNREKDMEVPDWVGRADRAQRNHHDNLAMIAAVILIAQVVGQTNSVTGAAAIALLLLRVAHSLFYIAGIAVGRSLAYLGSIIALGIIVWQIVT